MVSFVFGPVLGVTAFKKNFKFLLSAFHNPKKKNTFFTTINYIILFIKKTRFLDIFSSRDGPNSTTVIMFSESIKRTLSIVYAQKRACDDRIFQL
jgi:hypothetical protein